MHFKTIIFLDPFFLKHSKAFFISFNEDTPLEIITGFFVFAIFFNNGK